MMGMDGGWGGDDGYGGGGKKKGGGNNPANAWSGDVPGFKEALMEAFTEAGVSPDVEDVEAIIKKAESSAQKQAKVFFNDERSTSKMNAAQCKAFLEEVISAVMGAISNSLYDKPWFEKVSWNGAILMLTINTFSTGKIFTRVMKTEIMPFIDEGILAWSEEERITRQFWKALEGHVKEGKPTKTANGHLMKAYDEAHFDSPFGCTEQSAGLTPEVITLQEFVKGWMKLFANKAYNVLEAAGSGPEQVAALTGIFTILLEPDSPCLPLSLQPSLPAAPWAYIEQCA